MFLSTSTYIAKSVFLVEFSKRISIGFASVARYAVYDVQMYIVQHSVIETIMVI